MTSIKESKSPTYKAVGRVARALTYPVLSAEVELSQLELYTLTSLGHIDEFVSEKEHDTIDALRIMPGVGQGFFDLRSYYDTFESLEKKGLVKCTYPQNHALLDAEVEPGRKAVQVTLTQTAEELLDGMATNLVRSLSVLDAPEVRSALNQMR